MPANSKTPTAIDREAVKVLCKAVGIREGARRMGLSEERVMKWSQRDKNGPWSKQSDAIMLSTPSENGATRQLAACPHPVRTASQALENKLQEDSGATRLGFSTAARKVAQHVAKARPRGILKASKAIRDMSAVASSVHGWERQEGQQQGVTLNLLQIGGEMHVNP